MIIAAGLLASPALLAWSGFDGVVPERFLTNIRRNNEGFAFAGLAIMAMSLLQVRSRPLRVAWWMFLTVAFAVTEGGGAFGLPQWFTTLNEAVLGAIVLTVYLSFSDRARIRRWFYLSLALVVLLGELPVPGWYGSPAALWIVDHAEAWGFGLLTALYVDFIRPWPFEEGRVTSPLRQMGWYLGLVVVPIAVSALNEHGVDSVAAVGPYESALVWLQRIMEAFVAALILSVFFAVVNPGRRRHAERRYEPAEISAVPPSPKATS